MDDAEIIKLYFERSENAIRETEKSTRDTAGQSRTAFWAIMKMPKSA